MENRPLRRLPNEQIPLLGLLPPGNAILPSDFPERLVEIKERSGLSWNALAELLGVDPRQLSRWRAGVEPSGGAMLALMRLSSLIPGGVEALLDTPYPTVPNGRGRNGKAASDI